MSVFQGNVLKTEPVLITGLVTTVIALLLAFGVNLSQEQVGSIMAVVAALIAIVTRALVTPNTSVPEPTGPGTGAPPAAAPAEQTPEDPANPPPWASE